MYGLGTKRRLPANFGVDIKIPRLKKQNIIKNYAITTSAWEQTTVGTCGLCSQFISGTLKMFAGAYKHSDLIMMVSLPDVIELSLRDIARDIAKAMDDHIWTQLSAFGQAVRANSAVNNSVQTTTPLVARDILRATTYLDGGNNPRPPEGFYPVVIHPYGAFDLQASLTGNSWLEINKGVSDQALGNIYRAEVGRIFGGRIVTTTNAKRLFSRGGMCAQASGYQGFAGAPDSFYVTEVNEMTAKTYVKPLGSAGAADPVNQYATVGAKVFFTAIPASYTGDTRAARLIYGTSFA